MERGYGTQGLRVNIKKTKLMVSGPGLDLLRDSGAFPCAVCQSGVGVNSIQCSQCMYWVHKKCSGVRGKLAEDPDYVCPRCCDQARPIDNRPVTQVDVDGTLLDVESNFATLETCCVPAEDASLPSSPDAVLPGESLKGFFLF